MKFLLEEEKMLSQGKRWISSLLLIATGLIVGMVISSQIDYTAHSDAQNIQISEESADFLTQTGKAMAEITSAVKPAIVNISTSRTVKMGSGDPFFNDPFFRRFFGDRFGPQHPRERKSTGMGSGVIVSSDGYIITNYHVIKEADEITVLLWDKREFQGTVIGSDPKTEISIIKIDTEGLPTLPWGDSDTLQVGEVVLAVGNPYGLNQTVTMGIVSALGRANVGIADYEDFIQTDAAINPGNSGGALVNARGKLVGINTAIFSTSGGYQGIGFAIPSNMVKTVMDSLIKTGRVIRGWLGVSIQKLTPELAGQFNLDEMKGTLVSDVVENSPAEKAGLKRGDVILTFDDKKTDEPFILRNMVASTTPGEKHTLMILRDKERVPITVTIGELPADLQQVKADIYENVLKGVIVQDMNPEIADKLNIPERVQGVIIKSIDRESPAAGIVVPGDVIQEINRKKITSVKDYLDIVSELQKDDDVLLLVFRKGSSVFITISDR